MSDVKSGKTVYVLGAGASKCAGLPLQSEILSQVFRFKSKNIDGSVPFTELPLNSAEQSILQYLDVFDTCREELANFLVYNYASISDSIKYNEYITDKNDLDARVKAFNLVADLNVRLEDLFTLFDKIIAGREHFKTFSLEQIIIMKDALMNCIVFVLAYISATDYESRHLSRFAKEIIKKRLSAKQRDDNVSIISTNWDSVFEREIVQQCNEYNCGERQKVLLDLCFYDYTEDPTLLRIVSTHIKAKKHRNIKFLKLHGSLNWLICSYCGRVFVDYYEDIAIKGLSNDCSCRYCKKMFKDTDTTPQRHNLIVSPTFIKDLDNLHLKNIWQNAFIDLTEADQIIFIGYSFPVADFEMQCLLKRAIKPNTKINVILHESDDPNYYNLTLEKRKVSKKIRSELYNRLALPESRYRSFFGEERVSFTYKGLEGYVDELAAGG